ncbi:DUF2167 domain-containing protein [Shinella sp. WSJ-2]|nr:DUF2167 domain-containing protein [Shinella sp. WSJ-2]
MGDTNLKRIYAVATALVLMLAGSALAQPYQSMFPERNDFTDEAKKYLEGMDFKQGAIPLPGANATLNIPADFYYLDPKDTKTVIVDIWGNPADAAEGMLGMIFPAKYAPTETEAWGSLVEYSADGYISDLDAATTDYDDLLKTLKESVAESNIEREKQGFPTITLVGWASAPRYDQAAHALHWARDLIFGNEQPTSHTLNYSVRLLGREGVVQYNFVADLSQLEEIKAAIPSVIKLVQFDKGKTYEDYQQGDKLAAYGLAGIIAAGAGAKVAAKVGLLAVALAFLKKGGFLIVLLFGGVVRFFRGLFGKKSPDA